MDANWRPGPSTRFPWLVLFSEHFPRHPCSLMGHRLLVSCFRNTFHNFRLLPTAGRQLAGLAKMRRRFLRGPSRHLPYGEDESHFAMYLQALAQRARVPLRRQGDGWAELPFPADFGGAHRSAPRLHVELFHVIFETRY
jgi:hypothetical protein